MSESRGFLVPAVTTPAGRGGKAVYDTSSWLATDLV